MSHSIWAAGLKQVHSNRVSSHKYIFLSDYIWETIGNQAPSSTNIW